MASRGAEPEGAVSAFRSGESVVERIALQEKGQGRRNRKQGLNL